MQYRARARWLSDYLKIELWQDLHIKDEVHVLQPTLTVYLVGSLHYAGSFGSSATAYGLTKVLQPWLDYGRCSPIRRLLCLLEYTARDSLTVSRMNVNVYKVCLPDTLAL
jgi:hypothetical protein